MEETRDFAKAGRRGFEAFTGGDTDAMLRLLHPDVVWEENQAMGFAGLARRYHGHAGVLQWVADTKEVWESLESHVEGALVESEGFVIVTRLTARGRQSIEVDMLVYNVFWSRDGLACRRRFYFDRDEAVAAARVAETDLIDR
jgi:ketosteroid isomerase-like protein